MSSADILLIHGVGGRPASWDAVLSEIDPAVRQRARAADVEARPRQSVPDVARGILHRCPGPLLLVGHSFGGMLAQEMALLDDARVLGLVLVSTIPGATARVVAINRTLADDIESYGLQTVAPRFAAGLFAPGRLEQDPQLGTAFVADMLQAGTTSVCAALRAIAEWDATDRLSRVRCATTVISGDSEPDLDRQSLLAELTRARHEILRGTGHLPPLEAPADVARVITEMAISVLDL